MGLLETLNDEERYTMPPAARISDNHVCPMVTGVVPHVGGPINKGEPTVMIGYMPAARLGDTLICVGPPDVIVKGSFTVKIGYMPAARLTDTTAHGGTIMGPGCVTVMIGDAGGGGGGGAGGGPGDRPSPSDDNSSEAPTTEAVKGSLVSAAITGGALVATFAKDGTAEDIKSTFALKVVLDENDEPIPGIEVQITLPTGEMVEERTDSSGRVRIPEVDAPGMCSVTCELDDARLPRTYDFVAMGAVRAEALDDEDQEDDTEASTEDFGTRRIIALIEEHKVKTGETIKSLATANGMTWEELAEFNWDTRIPEQINDHLRDDVGCTKKTADGNNYMFDDSDDPGIMYIPTQWRQDGLATDTEHIIRVAKRGITEPYNIEIELHYEDETPMAHARFDAYFEDMKVEGETDADGRAIISLNAPRTDRFRIVLKSFPERYIENQSDDDYDESKKSWPYGS